jgi:RHS repeat-associated protein
MGSVTSVLSSTGEVLERRTYDAFGQLTCMLPDGTPVATSPTGLKVGFHGQLLDQFTGMYQMGYRWYSPVLGRWVSRDPIGLIGGYNLLNFVGNCPHMFNDTIGLWKEIERTGQAWARVCAEKCDTWQGLAGKVGLNVNEANAWVRQFDESPIVGKCYEIPNTVFIYNSEDRKFSIQDPLSLFQDTGLGVTDLYRYNLRKSAYTFAKLGYRVQLIDNGSSRTTFIDGWKSEGIYEVYFAGHGEKPIGAFIVEPNNPETDAVYSHQVKPPYKLHGVFALACFTGAGASWRSHVATGGVYVGFDGYSTWWNREKGIKDRNRFPK